MTGIHTITRVVLTGGPCGGKSTFMRELREEDPHAERYLMVPEAAPLLFQAGLNAKEKVFQRAVVHLQIELEDSCGMVAKPGQVVLCHRGALDPFAYWLRNGWDEEEFFSCVSKSREELHNRYAGVIHLQTVAIGAEEHYKRWPDAHRPETMEQAADIDRFCIVAWQRHPYRSVVDNSSRDWLDKSRTIRVCLLHAAAA